MPYVFARQETTKIPQNVTLKSHLQAKEGGIRLPISLFRSGTLPDCPSMPKLPEMRVTQHTEATKYRFTKCADLPFLKLEKRSNASFTCYPVPPSHRAHSPSPNGPRMVTVIARKVIQYADYFPSILYYSS